MHDTTHGDANVLFKANIDQNAAIGRGEDGLARYGYAIFLAQTYGNQRKSEIAGVLAPLSGQDYVSSLIYGALTSARTSTFNKQYPVLLASIDPDFKAFLMTLGWTASDFTASK